MSNKATNDSAALGELKETIRKQAREIEILREQLQQPGKRAVATVSHGGHGGGEPNERDISRYLGEAFYNVSIKRVGWLGLFLMSSNLTPLTFVIEFIGFMKCSKVDNIFLVVDKAFENSSVSKNESVFSDICCSVFKSCNIQDSNI